MKADIEGRWHGAAIAAGDAWMGPIVVKFGGSFFSRPDWPELARGLADAATAAAPRTIVVGGGPVVEGLREVDRIRRGDDRLLHDLAIAGMGITARLVAETVGLPLVARPPEGRGTPAAILDLSAWIADEPGRVAGLPASWRVTSDSLAARVAARHGLGLILAKCTAPPVEGLEGLVEAGWIDPCFPDAARGVPWVGWVTPRD